MFRQVPSYKWYVLGKDVTIFVGDTYPAGWKCIVVASGSLFKPQNLLKADVDGVLCPEHFAELLNLLKIGHIDIPKR
jgi:hypothetical protein